MPLSLPRVSSYNPLYFLVLMRPRRSGDVSISRVDRRRTRLWLLSAFEVSHTNIPDVEPELWHFITFQSICYSYFLRTNKVRIIAETSHTMTYLMRNRSPVYIHDREMSCFCNLDILHIVNVIRFLSDPNICNVRGYILRSFDIRKTWFGSPFSFLLQISPLHWALTTVNSANLVVS